ncbi:cortexillin-1 [Thecamonas trahens ATCC 50062]|uniref:Cortexillin-1 n=1 Tax=Thecamonas trahens ATCC 50062 TaxID=461836 RepID=A0A0L0DBX3_THETB|nr:cortexillin-1 [Thecamonas trahens ATCC 50062]KNC49566.1 cortexillin-1 [Thecamonas trahens ATCC 50062]|eukprot:XP_013757675.1 cortexillin-1 [Thecamonas trahens ATCC 50062]
MTKMAAADAGPSADGDEEEDDDPFKITDDMTEEEKMNIRYARIAAEQKAAREAEMRAMVSAAKKNVVEEASTVAQVDANEPMWVKQQKYAFAGWVNSILAEVGLHVQRDISKAFDDGLFLIPLAELLTEDYCAPHVKRPKFRIQKIQNVDLAMQLFRKHGFRGSYSNENLVDGNRELVLGFIFTLFVEFVGGDKSSRSKSDDILKWVQDHVNDKPQYDGVHVGDLSGSFKDGRAFGALLNALDNEYLDYGSAISADGHVANHEAAYDAAHNVLGVPKLLQAADMTAPDSDPDDKAVKMYLMLIRAAHAKRVADATARDSFAASLRDRLEAMDTGDLWRLYDGLCNHDGDCPECQCDLTPYFVFTRYPSKASTIKPLVEL